MMMNEMPGKLELWDVERLTPYADNARVHPMEQVEKLARSIAQLGFDVPIVVDEDGVILKGHGRRMAALHLGLKKVPVFVRDGLTPNQKRSIRIADNTLTALGMMDVEALSREVGRMMNEPDAFVVNLDDIGLGDFNFDLEDIDIPSHDEVSSKPSVQKDYSKPDLSQEKVPVSLYQVVVTCEDEDEQRRVYELVNGAGFEARVLTI